MPSLRIAVVGGSIAGCAVASELLRIGHEVLVFEQATKEPNGAGIGLLPNTFDALVALELVPRDLPRFEVREHVLAARSGDRPFGRIALRAATAALVLHWSDLWRALRANVPDDCYRAGVPVRGATNIPNRGATLHFRDGTSADFDLVVFADGHRSLGRSLVCAECSPNYRDYTLWRAVIEVEASRADAISGSIFRLSHGELPGHSVVYTMPSGKPVEDGNMGFINFAAYLPLPASELDDFLVDRDGARHRGSLAPGRMPVATEERLRSLLHPKLPPFFASLLDNARDTFAQAVFTAQPTRHRQGRILIAGDAGTLVPPLTGSGVLKALNHAFGLGKALRASASLDDALAAWDAEATAAGAVLARLGAQMEQALVWKLPDLAAIREAEAQAFWTATTRMPG